MKLVIDRIEEDFVVCENCESNEMLNLDRALFPEDIKSGALVELIDEEIVLLSNDETHERIKEKMNNLWT